LLAPPLKYTFVRTHRPAGVSSARRGFDNIIVIVAAAAAAAAATVIVEAV